MAPDLRIIWCETCEGTGRCECGPYEINRNDGSVHGHEYECHACEGVGSVQVEFGPITLDDLDAIGLGDTEQGAIADIFEQIEGDEP